VRDRRREEVLERGAVEARGLGVWSGMVVVHVLAERPIALAGI
jgi:hypothetical protein